MRRAVGYCLHEPCMNSHKGVFLLNFSGDFTCHNCKHVGEVVYERGYCLDHRLLFKRVQVFYNYRSSNDTHDGAFLTSFVVTDDSLDSGNEYVFYAPCIKMEAGADRCAMGLLSALNCITELPHVDQPPKGTELKMTWDVNLEAFRAQCEYLSATLEQSRLRL